MHERLRRPVRAFRERTELFAASLPQFSVSVLCGFSVHAHGVDTECAGVWAGISSALYVDCVGV